MNDGLPRAKLEHFLPYQASEGEGSMIVAAIDFGTTYSGWAFSFQHEFQRDPLKISAKRWIGGQLVSLKGNMERFIYTIILCKIRTV